MATAREKVMSARTSLVLDQPFFGALALNLEVLEDPSCPTAWTDGKRLAYNTKFIESLSHQELTALVAHEVMHCACGHPWRREHRDPLNWNIACDKVVNEVLSDSSFTLPQGALYPDDNEKGKSAEWVYARLPEPKTPKGKGKGKGNGRGEGQAEPDDGESNPQGEVRDAPTNEDSDGAPPPTESDWKQAVAQAAAQAEMRSDLPDGVKRFVGNNAKPKIDWRSVLRRFIQEHAKADYSWSQPNRRYVASGLYLPSLDSEEMGEILIAIDTSGSIDDVTLAQARAELDAIISECQPSAVTVIYCDAAIARVDRFEKSESIEWAPCGGGGTDFQPVFKHFDKMEPKPLCVIYITDLRGEFPKRVPEVPTLWITDMNETLAPFGETVRMG